MPPGGQKVTSGFRTSMKPTRIPLPRTGARDTGRWDYGPWFWPIFPLTAPPPNNILPYNGNNFNTTTVPEAFMDIPMVNGCPYPYINVNARAYRFRILNACNDRMVNLQMYVADVEPTTSAQATSCRATGFSHCSARLPASAITNAGARLYL